MNSASPLKNIARTLRWSLLAATALLSACANFLGQSAPSKPARVAKPQLTDAQIKDRARQALQKATASSNEYSACVMFSTSTHRSSNAQAPDIVGAASTNCAPKLDDYEQGMTTYFENSPIKPVSSPAPSAKERAHDSRVELEQTTRDAAIRSLSKAN